MTSESAIVPSSLSQSEPDLRRNSPVAFGLGSFGLESAYKVFWGFYVFYYVDVLGLAVTLAAIVNVAYGIWDAVNDPLVGVLSDNTRTRWGRRRPWGRRRSWRWMIAQRGRERCGTTWRVNTR